jgi:hypothetical protein
MVGPLDYKVVDMIDYSILAASWVCIGSCAALFVVLYKPAEDSAPPFPVPTRRFGEVIPQRPSSHPIVVEFSDGHIARLPSLGDSDPLTRIATRLVSARTTA